MQAMYVRAGQVSEDGRIGNGAAIFVRTLHGYVGGRMCARTSRWTAPHCGMRCNIDMEEADQALEGLERAWDNLLDRLRGGSAARSRLDQEGGAARLRPPASLSSLSPRSA
jgi:hypothetical protein